MGYETTMLVVEKSTSMTHAINELFSKGKTEDITKTVHQCAKAIAEFANLEIKERTQSGNIGVGLVLSKEDLC